MCSAKATPKFKQLKQSYGFDEVAIVPADVTALLQKVYKEPIKEKLVGDRVRAIKKAGATCAISLIPANTKRLAPIVAEAGGDILAVQSTGTSARHVSQSYRGLIFSELCEQGEMTI